MWLLSREITKVSVPPLRNDVLADTNIDGMILTNITF
jgi:hypothetical protein